MRLQNLSIIVQLSHHWKVQQIIQNLKSTLKITVFVCIYIGMKGLFCNTIPFQISTVEATNIFGQKHGPGTFWVVEQTSHCERWDFEFGSNTTAKYQNSLKQILASFQIFPWCLKAKFQIQPLRSVRFAVIVLKGISQESHIHITEGVREIFSGSYYGGKA